MAYRLRRTESVSAGVRRAVRDEIDEAIGELTDRAMDRHDAIHQARKRLKKIRAVLRLIRPAVPEIHEAENPYYRDLGRELSAARDATTMIEAIEALAERFKDDESAAAAIGRAKEFFVARRDQAFAAIGDLEQLSKRVVAGLRRARSRVADWPLPRKGFGTIAPGLKLSYKQGRDALQTACAEPTAENLHELRKRAKDHWYHVRLLECIWPETMACYRDTLEKISDMLGDDHDLAVACAALKAAPDAFGGAPETQPLLELIDRRQAELRAGAFSLARRIYAEKPKSLEARFEAYWEAMKSDALHAPVGNQEVA